MPLFENFNKSFNFLLHVQDAEIKINENEKPFEECMLSELKDVKRLNNFWSTEDPENNGGTLLEKHIQTMMESMKRDHKALLEADEVNDVFEMPEEEFKNLKTPPNEQDLKAFIKDIEKMDDILKMKITEEKKAKISRIQTEEESRDILTRLPSSKMSSGFKINLKEFLRLLNEAEKRENDFSYFPKLYEFDLKGLERDGIREEKKEKTYNKFVKRNIRLAKFGGGTLSLTDEEKLRIKGLLIDIEETKEAEDLQMKNSPGKEKVFHFHAIDEDVRSILNQIDEKLEVLTKEKKSLKVNQNVLSLLEQSEGEEKVFEEDEKENGSKGKQEPGKKSNRLNEINKLLSSMKGVSNEEINPLTEEEIGSLIQQSLIALGPFESEKTCEVEGKDWSIYKQPEEVIVELVSSAKLLMPKFKYRFDEC